VIESGSTVAVELSARVEGVDDSCLLPHSKIGGASKPQVEADPYVLYVQLPLALSNQHLQVAPCTAYSRSANESVIGSELGIGRVSCKVGESRSKLVDLHTANRGKDAQKTLWTEYQVE
jgi:hypothetical protein